MWRTFEHLIAQINNGIPFICTDVLSCILHIFQPRGKVLDIGINSLVWLISYITNHLKLILDMSSTNGSFVFLSSLHLERKCFASSITFPFHTNQYLHLTELGLYNYSSFLKIMYLNVGTKFGFRVCFQFACTPLQLSHSVRNQSSLSIKHT